MSGRLNGRRVAIIGAGPAGLAAATALAQRGAQVDLFEQAAKLGSVGAGLQISPNGVAVLKALGIHPQGPTLPYLQSEAVELRDHAKGRRVLRLDLPTGRWPHMFLLVHRAELIAALAHSATAAGVQIHFGQPVTLDDLSADLVVAADGVKSPSRHHLNPQSAAFFTGQVAWRAVIADQGAPQATVFMGPGRHLVTYPLTDARRNIVAVQERAAWAEEDWDIADDPDNLRQAFHTFCPDVRNWLDQVEEVKLWGLYRHPVAQNWSDGRHVLIGDAAHPTLPFLAQGANLALEDAYVLARKLDESDQDQALEEFEAARKPRVTKAIRAANENAKNYHIARPMTRAIAHSGLRLMDRLAPNLMLSRFDWLYGTDVTI